MEDKKAEVKEVVPAFVSNDIVESARRFIEIANLPKEALPSFISAAQAYFALKKQVADELRLSIDKKKSLVGTPPGMVLSDNRLKDVERFSRSNGFPLSTLYIAKGGAIAAKAVGWRARIQADPRCMKGFENVVHKQEVIDGQTIFITEGTLMFFTGERYPAVGSASSDEPRGGRTPVAHLLMIADTRCQTRAFRMALGLPLDIAEDVIDTERQLPAAEPFTAEGEVKNIADLIARANSELGLRRKDILDALGVGSLGEIEDLMAAWAKLQEKVKKAGS